MAELTDQDRTTLRDAAMGAMALVSGADRGFFDLFKESKAGGKALGEAPKEIKELFPPGLSMPPFGRPDEVEQKILGELKEAIGLLQQKAPNLVDGYRRVVLAACDAVAEAAKGVSDTEQAVIDKVRAAVTTDAGTEGSGQDASTTGSTATDPTGDVGRGDTDPTTGSTA